jgi:SAM-dependent methyltransferase
MALYDLVALKRSLISAINAESAANEIRNLVNSIEDVKLQVNNISNQHLDYINGLIAHYNSVLDQVQQPVDDFQSRLEIINQEITTLTYKLFANNYELEERYGTPAQIRTNRFIPVNNTVKDVILQRIMLHTDWKYPALEIGCRDGEWTEHLVAADPLYVIDRQQEFLDSTAGKFNPKYQERLRRYLFKDTDLSFLPQAQFAFIFSWGYFNFVSIDIMTQMLKEIMKLLRPGGVFLFSFNDGDTIMGAGLAESFSRSYMPKSILIPLCQSLGFTILKEFEFDHISWIEIQRPGELSTVKAHQVLGKILPLTP